MPHRLTASPPHRPTASPPHRLTASPMHYRTTSADNLPRLRGIMQSVNAAKAIRADFSPWKRRHPHQRKCAPPTVENAQTPGEGNAQATPGEGNAQAQK